MVDIKRQGVARNRRIRRVLYGIVVAAGALAMTWGFSKLEPAPPSVDRSSIWMGEVKRGPLVIEIRGTGTLVPEEIRWVAASTAGRIERILALPGAEVAADTIIVEMRNPALEREALDTVLQLKKALAELDNLKVEIETQNLAQEAQTAIVRADYLKTRLQAEQEQALAAEGLVSSLDLRLSEITAEESARRYEVEQRRLEMISRSRQARLAAKRAEIEQLEGLYELRRREVEMLRVRAGISGVLQQTPVEVGRQVTAGEILGKVAVPSRLKAELRIPEALVGDVHAGLPAAIDTRNGLVEGRVTRIDPAAREGTVTVDVAFTGNLPAGVRPDQNIDGTIQIAHLADVLQMGRPAFAQEDATIGMFRIGEDGSEAVWVSVHLGRSSVSVIQVLDGLKEGDRVILSDTSQWDDFERIRLD